MEAEDSVTRKIRLLRQRMVQCKQDWELAESLIEKDTDEQVKEMIKQEILIRNKN